MKPIKPMKPMKKTLRLSRTTLRQLTAHESAAVRAGLLPTIFATLDSPGCGTYVSCITLCAGDCSTGDE